MQKLNLRELKGAPLSIILAIVMSGNRNVSVSYLVTETGYSDKTINSGLDMLRSRQIVTQTGRCRYQLTGENIQLPLYWGETTEPADPSPASDQPALFELGTGAEKFSGKISKTGKIPELEYRIARLEKRVSDIENRKNSEEKPEKIRNLIEIPAETGEIPDDNNLLLSLSPSTETNINQDHNNNASGKIPENGKIPTFEESLKMIEDVNGYYCETNYGDRIFPDYLSLEHDDMKTIAELHPDPDVISFAIPRSSTIEALKRWAGFNYQQAKEELLRFIGITGKMAAAIMADNKVTLEEIDFHYWDWQKHKEERPTWTIGTVGSRIIRGFDRLAAKTSDPLNFGYLG